ncbi:MAG: serine/threonine protein kinase [Candidatus Sericytochromatia bacterium]|nr:serine/threonine protein kinase [Candidatus Sericytochromatia bacterium]
MSKSPEIGEFVGKYKIESFLGQGYTSNVYKAKHKHLNTDVALKILSSDLMIKDPNMKNIFFNEALNNAKLSHNNLVRVLDIDDEFEYTYIVMEYVDGFTLDSIINHLKIVEPLKTIRVGLEICKALRHALSLNIIHRDVKPANIMINKNSDIKLTDFGLSKSLDETNKFEKSKGDIFGTPYYMSPEQFMDSENVNFHSDMYSLGVTLYHLITGRLPFETNNLGELISMHINELPIRPETINPIVSEAFSNLILKLMEKDPEMRHYSYDKLIDDLEKIELDYKVEQVIDSNTLGFKNTFENVVFEKLERYKKEFKTFKNDENIEEDKTENNINLSEEDIIGKVLTNLNKQYNDVDSIFKNTDIENSIAEKNSINTDKSKTELESSTRLKHKYQKYFKQFGGVDIHTAKSESDT